MRWKRWAVVGLLAVVAWVLLKALAQDVRTTDPHLNDELDLTIGDGH